MAIGDRAGISHWDALWQTAFGQPPVDPRDRGVRNHVNRRFHWYFSRQLATEDFRGQMLLEAGCGGSRWLPYFAKEFGFEVCGIDYSELGCRLASAILRRAGLASRVVQADFFHPPTELLGAFDVVVSLGVVEHFKSPSDCVSALGDFLKPGGLMITSVPNMTGCLGWLQRTIDRRVYELHTPLDREALATAHTLAGLQVQSSEYFPGVNWCVVNAASWQYKRARRLVERLLAVSSGACWLLDDRRVALSPNRFTSPYVLCSAIKRGAAG